MKLNCYRKEGNKLIFTGDGEMIYFIPEKYFENNTASVVGNTYTTIGVFNYGWYDKSGKLLRYNRFYLPTRFECVPSSMSKEKEKLLKDAKEPQDYRLLHFKNGDELIKSLHVPMVNSNIEAFNNLLIRANLPDNIPYDEIQDYILENARINNFNYKVPPQIHGLYISELYRNPSNLAEPFRYTDMKDMTDYKAVTIFKAPKYNSPYTAITSENADEAIAAAMSIAGNAESPLEPIMMESAYEEGPDADDFFEEEVIF